MQQAVQQAVQQAAQQAGQQALQAGASPQAVKEAVEEAAQQAGQQAAQQAAQQVAQLKEPKEANLGPGDCSNVKDWNFVNAEVTQNNLGGVGPNKEDKEEIRYANVVDGVDLVLTTDSKDYATNPKVKEGERDGVHVTDFTGVDNNGISGKFGVVNVKGNTSVALKFTLVESGTDTPVEVAPEQTVFFSVYDLDSVAKGSPGSFEYVNFTTPVDSWGVTDTSTVQVTGDNDHLSAKSGRTGTGEDNPTDPMQMTQLQKDSAVRITYKGKNTWGMTFGENAPKKAKGGRNLLFAGRAEDDCPQASQQAVQQAVQQAAQQAAQKAQQAGASPQAVKEAVEEAAQQAGQQAAHQLKEPKEAAMCSSGISNAKGTVCCAKSCGECGGSGCSKRPGGPDKCCSQKFTRQCKDVSDTACTMSDSLYQDDNEE
jgi:hypothetical protein